MGYCSHSVGLMYTIEQWQEHGLNDIPERISCTSLPRKWNKPRGSKIKPNAISDVSCSLIKSPSFLKATSRSQSMYKCRYCTSI